MANAHWRRSAWQLCRVSNAVRQHVEQLEARVLLSGATALLADPHPAGAGGAATLLKDIDPRTASSRPVIGSAGATAYFLTADDANSATLWRSDGTSAGTVAVKTFTGLPTYSSLNLIGNLGDVEIFWVNHVLWRTDGTPDQTFQLAAQPVNGDTVFSNNYLYFGTPGWELRRTDGTLAGTSLVQDVDYGPGSFSSASIPLADVSGTLFIGASNRNGDAELWKTDGTPGGAVLVKDLGPLQEPQHLTNVGGKLFFVTPKRAGGFELWQSDGTTNGTTQIHDFPAASTSFMASDFTSVNGSLFFATPDAGLWVSDGTPAGTQELPQRVAPSQITALGTEAYFIGGGNQLWRTDGTAAGTRWVIGLPKIENLVAFGDKLLFSATDPELGNELWVSDGSGAGTHPLTDINPGPASSFPFGVALVGDSLFFVADDGLHGAEPWTTDGTPQGTRLVADLNTTPLSSNPGEFVSFDHNAFFVADGVQSGLYKTDGTADGTVLVDARATGPIAVLNGSLYFTGLNTIYKSAGNPGDGQIVASPGFNPIYQFTVEGIMYFTANGGRELWRSDGTAAGTYALLQGAGTISYLTAADNFVFFAESGFSSAWRTDGTKSGTYALGVVVGSNSPFSTLPAIAAVGHYVVFYGDDNNGEGVVYSTDGTVSGTQPLRDATGRILYFSSGLNSRAVVGGAGGTAYFAASAGTTGQYALYQTHGTAETTTSLRTIDILPNDGTPFGLVNADGLIYFWNSQYGSGAADLWRSDGTPGGTFAIKMNFAVGVADLTPIGSSVYFLATQSPGARMLWVSDGTAAGTTSLPAGSAIPADPESGATVDGASFYAGTDAGHGTELWVMPLATLPAAPGTPTSLEATAVGPGAVELSWIDAPANNESSLGVERSTDPNFGAIDETTVLTPMTTRWVDHIAAPGTSYYYRVFAANASGSSGNSNIADVQLGNITGRVFEDENYNTTLDSGEPGLFAITIYADLNNNGIFDPGEPSAATDLQGNYVLGGFTSGSFTIRQMVAAHYRPTVGSAPIPVTVTTGRTSAGPLFGEVPIGNVGMDFAYLVTLAQHYGQMANIRGGDLNDDGTVNFADLLLTAQNYGHSLPYTSAGTSAPGGDSIGTSRPNSSGLSPRAGAHASPVMAQSR